MDSLLANYASSDEEEHEEQPSPPRRLPPAKPGKSEFKSVDEKDEDFTPKRGGIFDSLPPPKSSLFNSLPPPKSQSFPNPKPQSEVERQKEVDKRDEQNVENPKPKSGSSSLFSSLPKPKSSSSSSSSAAKRVVQFKPPIIMNPNSGSFDDEDEDADEDEEERKRKKSKESISTSSAASFLSSIPAPRFSATLGALPSASGTSRRSMLETNDSASNVSTVNATGSDAFVNPDAGYSNNQSNDTNYAYNWGSEGESHAYYSVDAAAPNGTRRDAGVNSFVRHVGDLSHEVYDHSASLGGESYAYYGAYGAGSTDASSVSTVESDVGMSSNTGPYEAVDYSDSHGQHVEYTNYGGSYGDLGNNAQYENIWANTTALPEVSGVVENALPVPGKRGRKDVPPQILEVKQDELMKNRPREDQVKLTGIAFGPAYQPASTKGKPTKLHKRKHQIGSLYFDMKQKEMELAERRSKGFLTKAQTQAKYGW